jgi:hypothetical protein
MNLLRAQQAKAKKWSLSLEFSPYCSVL